MKRSTHGILTTHMGGLAQPRDLYDMLQAKAQGKAIDASRLATRVREAVFGSVKHQATVGISSVNDGEMSKPNYSTYVKERLNGMEGDTVPRGPRYEEALFPDYFARQPRQAPQPTCNGPLSWKDFSAVETDIQNLKDGVDSANATDTFMSANSPGNVRNFIPNRYYKSDIEYLHAIAAVMRREYEAIANAGFILQIDCPDLTVRNAYYPDATNTELRSIVGRNVEILNEATRAIPPEQVRVHVCWGRNELARVKDTPLRDLVDLLLRCRAQGLTIVSANGRHEYEWKVWKDHKLPDGKVLIPGVIDNTTATIEHPETVADRITRYATIIGRENVMGGVNCGFGNQPTGTGDVVPTVAWAKLQSLVDGAALATKELWRK